MASVSPSSEGVGNNCQYGYGMAKRLESLPVRSGYKYPWSEWTDGAPWLVVRGEDYSVTHAVMQRSIHHRAARLGTSVRTQVASPQELKRVHGIDSAQGGLYFQFYKPKPKNKTLKRGKG